MDNMKPKHTDWTDIVAQRLQEEEANYPKELFEIIDKEVVNETVKRRRYTTLRHRVAWAAVIAFAIIALTQIPTGKEDIIIDENYISEVTQIETQIPVKPTNIDVVNNIFKKDTLKESYILSAVNNTTISSELLTIEKDSVVTTETITNKEDVTVSSTKKESQDAGPTQEEIIKNNYLAYYDNRGRSDKKRGYTITVSGVGGVSSNSESMVSVLSRNLMLKPMNSDGEETLVSVPLYDNYSYTHHQPIKFGLSAAKDIGHNLSVGLGITYTMLNSTVKTSIVSANVDQRLNLIGVPLYLNWSFVRGRIFSAYVGGEVEAEWCVSAHMGGEALSEKNTLFSGSLHAGGEARIVGGMSLMVEPKLTHYFTKTDIPTIVNNNTIFNIKIGLRYRF